jgi:hypothetical protein
VYEIVHHPPVLESISELGRDRLSGTLLLRLQGQNFEDLTVRRM